MGDLAQLQRDAVMNHIRVNGLVHRDIQEAIAANRVRKIRSRSQSRSRSSGNKKTKRRKPSNHN